ncbi:MAG: LytTR family DNA-binding domain-containing protein [Bacteroidota bacterium]
MNILILEDEVPAAKKLAAYIKDFFAHKVKIDTARSVVNGSKLLKENHTYDLILSDIQLLDGSAFQIFQSIPIKTPIIFCTAYHEHLLQAFQTNGIAYILKPYSYTEFESAFKKYQALFPYTSYERQLFQHLTETLENYGKNYRSRFAIKKRGGIKLLETKEIAVIQANGDFCKLMDCIGQLHAITKSIGVLSAELDPKIFFRINRSQMINIAHIDRITPYSKNRLAIKVNGSTQVYITSAATTKNFRIWLEQ